jgi:hypothetical protein
MTYNSGLRRWLHVSCQIQCKTKITLFPYFCSQKLQWTESIQNFLSKKTYSSQVNGKIGNLEIQLELLEEEEAKLQSRLADEDKS